MRILILSFVLTTLGLATTSLASDAPARIPAPAQQVASTVREAGPDGQIFVGYLATQALDYEPWARWPGVRAKRLSEDPISGRLSVQAEFPAGWALRQPPIADPSTEIVMLDGDLEFGAESLRQYDFAFLPSGAQPPALSSRNGAHALVFFDPAAADAAAIARQRERGHYVTRFDPTRWQPASLAKSAGATADLRVMHLKKDPFTTARTWYVRLGAGMTVPWEVHSMVEEGYVMEGDYRLAECLPTRTVIGDYRQGGYFWRPGGIPHSGPESGPEHGVIWLQRSPVALDVVFYQQCGGGRASGPVGR